MCRARRESEAKSVGSVGNMLQLRGGLAAKPDSPSRPSPPLPRQSLLLDPSLKLLSFAGPSLLQGGGVGGEEEG